MKEITPEVEAQLREKAKEWNRIALDCGPTNKEAAERCFAAFYRNAGCEPVPTVWVRSPKEGKAEVTRRGGDYRQYIEGHINNAWVPYLASLRDVAGLELPADFSETLEASCRHTGIWWAMLECVVTCERPQLMKVDRDNRYHAEEGPAIRWSDGYSLYFFHGIQMPADWMENPGSRTVAKIDAEQNAEVRRCMLEMFGFDRYVLESNAEVLDEDTDLLGAPRRLLRVKAPRRGEEDVVIVEVTNSSPEPDGAFKKYHLGVHPQLCPLLDDRGNNFGRPQKMTCHNAVASTFGLRGEEYRPEAES